MSRAVAVLALGALSVVPLPAAASEIDVRLGGFFPRAQSNLFRDDSELYTVDRDDWQGLTGGAEFRFRVAPSLYVGLNLDGYGRTVHTQYREFTRESGREITQSLKLNIVPLGASLRWLPRDGRRDISPYVGAGVDAFFYKYEEFGDFIDFESEDLDIIPDSFVSDGAAPGFHVLAGLRVPVSDDFSLVGEGRYQWARTDMGDDFRGNRLDLGGWSATFGVSLRF
jgi:opacity protein-like surface antigen